MQERRRFFRVDDEVIMDFRTISREEFEEWRSKHQQQSSELKQLEQELTLIIHQVRSSNPVVGQALELLNRKINLLHKKPQQDGQAFNATEALIRVNLSACGIAFYTDENLQNDTHLLLSLQLKPSNATLSLAGTLVSVHEVNHEHGKFQVRINFDGLKEAEQEMLIQHLFQLQSRSLRQQRGD